MSDQRLFSWNAALCDIRDERAKIPAGLLATNASISLTISYDRRPLVIIGKFDRSAIMWAATKAAHVHQARFSCSWAEAMTVALKAAWGAAKPAHHMAAH